MKIFISYKQDGVSENELTEKLGKIRDTLHKLGHDNYIYFLDTQFENQTAKEIITKAKNELETSDMMISFINYSGISEGMMQELGIAFGLNKKILVLANKKVQTEYYLTYGISNNTVFYDNFDEIHKLLEYNLPTSI